MSGPLHPIANGNRDLLSESLAGWESVEELVGEEESGSGSENDPLKPRRQNTPSVVPPRPYGVPRQIAVRPTREDRLDAVGFDFPRSSEQWQEQFGESSHG